MVIGLLWVVWVNGEIVLGIELFNIQWCGLVYDLILVNGVFG